MSSMEERLDELQNRLILGEVTEQEYQRLKALLQEELTGQGVHMTDSVVKGDVQSQAQNANAGMNLAGMFAAQLVTCRICGRKNEPKQTFRCRECGRDDLCLEHFEASTKRCEECAAKHARPAQTAGGAYAAQPTAPPRYVPPPPVRQAPPVAGPAGYQQPPPQAQGYPPAGQTPQQQQYPYLTPVGNQAKSALILGVVAVCTFWVGGMPSLICGILAIRSANLAKKQVQAGQLPLSEDSRATVAMALGWVGVVLSFIVWASMFQMGR